MKKFTIKEVEKEFKQAFCINEQRIFNGLLYYDYFNDRQFTAKQRERIAEKGQIPQLYNILRRFTPPIAGHLLSRANDIITRPTERQDVQHSLILNQMFKKITGENDFDGKLYNCLEQAILTGLFILYVGVKSEEKTDENGNLVSKVDINNLSFAEILFDLSSNTEDFSDSRFFHRFSFYSEYALKNTLKKRGIFDFKNMDFSEIEDGENLIEGELLGKIRELKAKEEPTKNKKNTLYILIHSILRDSEGNAYSIYWTKGKIFYQEKLDPDFKSPYVIFYLNSDPRDPNPKSFFSPVMTQQQAINKALLTVDLAVNATKTFYDPTSVNMTTEKFEAAINSMSAVIPISDPQAIIQDNNRANIAQQAEYIEVLIKQAQEILGLTDHIVGLAPASESGTKFQLQQSASLTHLYFLYLSTDKFLKLTGRSFLNIIKKYYNYMQVIEVSEGNYKESFEINKPLLDPNGNPLKELIYNETEGKYKRNDKGQLLYRIAIDESTKVNTDTVDVDFGSTLSGTEEEENKKNLIMIMQLPATQNLLSINPSGYFKVIGGILDSLKIPNTNEIVDVYKETSDKLQSQQSQNPFTPEEQENQQKIVGLGNTYSTRIKGQNNNL